MNESRYIEIWEVNGNPNIYKLLAIPYTDSQCPTYSHLLALRDNIAERHNCKLIRLLGTVCSSDGKERMNERYL